jgi:hypothetical protein
VESESGMPMAARRPLIYPGEISSRAALAQGDDHGGVALREDIGARGRKVALLCRRQDLPLRRDDFRGVGGLERVAGLPGERLVGRIVQVQASQPARSRAAAQVMVTVRPETR